MNSADFDPKNHIDRDAEQKLFERLITLGGESRVLVISDKGGMGKSSLLKRFEYQCQWAMIPCSLTAVGELGDHSEFAFVAKVRSALKDVPCAGFDRLNDARLDGDFTPFGSSGLSAVTATAHVQNVSEGGVAAGSIETLVMGDAVINEALRRLTGEQEARARERCIDAFFEDLRALAPDQPVVVMVDAFEKCRPPLRGWLESELLRRRVFGGPSSCPGLIVVLAGREVPDLKALPGGLYPRFVESVESLSRWEKEHVRDFLGQHGVDFDDTDVEYLQQKLCAGMTLQGALSFVDALKLKAG